MSEVFLKAVNMSISAGWLVLAVLALRLLLKRAPRWIPVLLWGIVAVRLMFPFSVESALSLIPSAETIPLDIGMNTTPTIHSGVSSINAVVNPIISHSNTPAPGASVNPLQITIAILANIWVLGVLAMLLYTAVSYMSLRRKLATATCLEGNVFRSENVSSPFVLGILKPRIYLPYSLEGQNRDHVVAHERAHIRRKDHWWKPLGFLLLSIYWFHPLMWVAYILLCRDIELACDEKVIAELGSEQRADYTQALVACSVGRRSIAACPLAFGEVGVKERVKSILNYRKPAFWIIVTAVLTCAAVAVCFLTDPFEPGFHDVLQQNGYVILSQNDRELTLTVPKDSLPNEIYTADGVEFDEGQVVVFSEDTTTIWLRKVMLSNESPDQLYFVFDITHDIEEKGTILSIHSRLPNDQYTFRGGLRSKDLRDSYTVYPGSVQTRGHGPDSQLWFYVSTDACKQAEGTMYFEIVLNEIEYEADQKNRSFSMSGDNVSDLNPQTIVDRIMDLENMDNGDVYVNANNFSLTLDADFTWADSQAIRYFFWENHEHHSGQLRIFPQEGKYFLTETEKWTYQDRVFLLRHYLDAIKYLPQEAIRQMAPADRYLIQLREEGTPSDYDRVIRYSSRGVEETAGWLIHLQVHPLHADGEGYSGTGEEWVELFYGASGSSDYVQTWFDYTRDPVGMSYEEDLKIQVDAFPDTTFRYTPYGITVGEMDLISGMPVWSAYFCDLTGDGKPEICAEASWGSGIIDNRVIIFDYANGARYTLADRGNFDYHLRLENDGLLYVDKREYKSGKTVFSGELTYRDGGIEVDGVNVQGVHVFRAGILEIHDTYFLVQPVTGSSELLSAGKIEIPLNNMSLSPQPRVGDILHIEYDGQIQETYPARIPNVYHMALEQTHVWSAFMTPTETNLEGLQAGALLVPMGVKTFRYALSNMPLENVTVETRLLSFTEATARDDIQWEVWSLKEYPDRTVVMMLSPDYGGYPYKYDPPGRCADTALEEAVRLGNPVMVDGVAAHGREAWREFYDLTRQGTPASVTVAEYITLDPNRCDSVFYEVYAQDYPSLSMRELKFDGKRYTLNTESSEGSFVQRFEYLVCYETQGASSLSAQVPARTRRYVLVNDKNVTWEQLWKGLASSQSDAYIHHAVVYTETVENQNPSHIPDTLERVDLMDGDVLLAAYQEEKMLNRLAEFLRNAESRTHIPEGGGQFLGTLVLTGTDGQTVKLELDLENDGFLLNGIYYDYGPGTDGTMELLRLLGFEQWPSQRQ